MSLEFLDWLICFFSGALVSIFPFNGWWRSSLQTHPHWALPSRERKKLRVREKEKRQCLCWCVIHSTVLLKLWVKGLLLLCYDRYSLICFGFVIWVPVFLVLDHPTRRTIKVMGLRKLWPKRTLSKNLHFLTLITPVGLAQVCHQILNLSFILLLLQSLFTRLAPFNCVEFCLFCSFSWFLHHVFFHPSCCLLWSGSSEVVLPLLQLVRWFDG